MSSPRKVEISTGCEALACDRGYIAARSSGPVACLAPKPRVVVQLDSRLPVFRTPLQHASDKVHESFLLLTLQLRDGFLQAHVLRNRNVGYPFTYVTFISHVRKHVPSEKRTVFCKELSAALSSSQEIGWRWTQYGHQLGQVRACQVSLFFWVVTLKEVSPLE